MNGEDFEGLLDWVQEKESRTMDINVGRLYSGVREVSAFVYDYELLTGQRVHNVEEIDLKQANIDALESAIARLKKATGD